MNVINKIGLVIIQDKKLLLTLKKGTDKLIIPGGKIDSGESHIDCLEREIKEELGAEIKTDSIKFLTSLEDRAEFEPDTLLKMELYIGNIKGEPKALSEIEEFVWFSKDGDFQVLSHILSHKIMPYLIEKKYL